MAVTEEQIQAAIARKQQAEQTGVNDEQIQAAIQRKQAPAQPAQAPAIQDADASINAAIPQSAVQGSAAPDPRLAEIAGRAIGQANEAQREAALPRFIRSDVEGDPFRRRGMRKKLAKLEASGLSREDAVEVMTENEEAMIASNKRTDAQIDAISDFVGSDEGLQTIGGIVGGIAAGPPGAVVGGAAGRFATEFAKSAEEDPFPESLGEFGEQVSAASREAIGPALKGGTVEGLLDAAGLGVAKAGGFIFSPLIKKIAPRAAALASSFVELGGRFSPAQLDKKFVIKFGESVARSGIGGKELMKQLIDEPADRAIVKMSKIIAGDIAEGMSKLEPDIMADSLRSAIIGVDSTFDEVFSPAWSQLDDLTKTASVSTAGIKDFAEKEIFEMLQTGGVAESAELVSEIAKIDKMPNFITYKGMRRVKTNLTKKIKSLDISGDAAQGAVKKLASLADEALTDPISVKGASKEAKLLHANLRVAYRTGKKAFNDAFPLKLINKLDDPRAKARAVETLFPDNGIDNIKNIRNGLTKTIKGKVNESGVETWNQLQRTWYEDLIARSTDSQTGKIISHKLETNIKKFGLAASKELLGPKQAKSLRRLREFAKITQNKKNALGVLFIKGIQTGGGIAAVGGLPFVNDNPVTMLAGGTVAIAPAAWALAASKPASSALIRGLLKMPKGSKRIPGIVAKLNKSLLRDAKILPKDKKQQPRNVGGLRGRDF